MSDDREISDMCEVGHAPALSLTRNIGRASLGRTRDRRGFAARQALTAAQSTDIASVKLRCASGVPVSSAQVLNAACTAARAALPLGSPAKASQRLSAVTTDGVRMKVSFPAIRRKYAPELPPSWEKRLPSS